MIFERFNFSNHINEIKFETIFSKYNIPLYKLLRSEWWFKQYPDFLRRELLSRTSNFELLLQNFTDSKNRYVIPNNITKSDLYDLAYRYISDKKGGHWYLTLAGFSILAMFFLNHGYSVYCFTFLVGISITHFNIYFVVKLQKDVEQEFMGRIFSVVYIAAALLVPVSDLLFGAFIPILKENSLLFIGVGVSWLPLILQYVYKKEVR